MTATSFFNAMKLAQKSAAIGFVTILTLGITTTLATAISTLLALLIPVFTITTKAAIFGYPLFLAGVIALNIKQQCQTKEASTIAILPPSKPYEKHIKQEIIQNENDVLITSPSFKVIFDHHFTPKAPTWQQQILTEIQQPTTEIQEASEPTEDTASRHETQPLNNQLTILTICWQAIGETAVLLDAIKASEMKTIASELQIPKYRNMNKTQLLLEIVEAHESAPAFSQ
jgi:hypothetical protein